MTSGRDLPTSLDLLRGFEAAARHLSFTAAGEELCVTQSAISRQVQMLEEQLGVKLFVRRTRALALTEAGARYHREIASALRQLRDATANVRSTANARVRVSTSVTFASLWLVPRLRAFQARHEEIPVHVLADNALSDFRRESIDVAVRYTTRELAGDGALMLFGETVMPVCSPSLVPSGTRQRTAAELLRFPLLHYVDPKVSMPWLSWDVWLEAVRLQAPRNGPALSFSHYDQVIQAAIAGQGVALGRLPLVQDLVASGRLVQPLDASISTSGRQRAYWLLVSPVTGARPQVQTFVDWLKAATA